MVEDGKAGAEELKDAGVRGCRLQCGCAQECSCLGCVLKYF